MRVYERTTTTHDRMAPRTLELPDLKTLHACQILTTKIKTKIVVRQFTPTEKLPDLLVEGERVHMDRRPIRIIQRSRACWGRHPPLDPAPAPLHSANALCPRWRAGGGTFADLEGRLGLHGHGELRLGLGTHVDGQADGQAGGRGQPHQRQRRQRRPSSTEPRRTKSTTFATARELAKKRWSYPNVRTWLMHWRRKSIGTASGQAHTHRGPKLGSGRTQNPRFRPRVSLA